MKIKQVVSQTGIPERTIRFYEERGMIKVPTERRNGRSYHEFTEENVEDLKRIAILRKARFSLDEILVMQKHPGMIQRIVQANYARLEAEKEEIEKLTQDESLETAADWAELSRWVEHSLRAVPGYVSPLRFGRGDPESMEEKQEAIDAYRKNTKFRANLPLYISIALAIFFLGLAILFGVLLYQKEPGVSVAMTTGGTVPAPSGTTEGWIYYKLDQGLARSDESGMNEELVFQTQEMFEYILDTDKIYISTDSRLFSINADGSGSYEYPSDILPSYKNTYSDTGIQDIFLRYGDSIYILQQQEGLSETLVRVPVDGGPQEDLGIDTSNLSNLCGWIWEDVLYLYGVHTPDSDTYLVSGNSGGFFENRLIQYNLSQREVLPQITLDLASETGEGLYFGEDAGYFRGSGSDLGWPLIRVTKENPNGEILRYYEEYILAMSGDYLLLVDESIPEMPVYMLENLETGNRVGLEGDFSKGLHLGINFTPIGFRVGIGEFAPYP